MEEDDGFVWAVGLVGDPGRLQSLLSQGRLRSILISRLHGVRCKPEHLAEVLACFAGVARVFSSEEEAIAAVREAA